MTEERYEFSVRDDFLDYEFYSEGPKGIVKKIVQFTPKHSLGTTYFNLGLGDRNENKKRIDDRIVTNNMDRDKILATVAATVLFFTERFPDMFVYAKGSMAARTRLYQMGIATNWEEIAPVLHVFGFTKNTWQPFRKNINYEAFLVLRK